MDCDRGVRKMTDMAPVPKPKRKLRRTFLKEWREYRGLTQEAAAERLNISRTLLSKIENAKSPYTQGFMEAAAEAYGCEVPDLIMRDPHSPVWSIYDTLRALPRAQQEHVEAIVKTFRRAS
jgi:transcriptional regulator with XRE-family HTH domain